MRRRNWVVAVCGDFQDDLKFAKKSMRTSRAHNAQQMVERFGQRFSLGASAQIFAHLGALDAARFPKVWSHLLEALKTSKSKLVALKTLAET